jgi:Apea-like HEPN
MNASHADSSDSGERESSKLSDIRTKLEAWYNAAIEFLADNPQSHVMNLPVYELEWYEIGANVYGQRSVSLTMFTPQTTNALMLLDAYIDLEDAAKHSSAIGPLFGQQVGSYMVTHGFDFWQFAGAAIPTAEEVASGAIRSFEETYADLEEQLSEFSNYTTICLLQGISFAQQHIELESDLTIEALTSDEIKAALKIGLISSPFGATGSTFWVRDHSLFALKKLWRIQRRWGGEPVPSVGEEMREKVEISSEADRLIQCLGLLTREPVFVTGALTRQTGHSFIFPRSGDAEFYGIWPTPRQFQGVNLDAGKCSDLQRLWSISKSTASTQLKAFGLALRRLGYGLQRNRTEDRLLDIYIAAEAFYLAERAGEPKDRGEMSYRLSHRAAAWSEGTMPGWTRSEVFRQIRAGYTVRSALAHGGSPDPKVIRIKGELVPIDELFRFVQCIEDIVRAGLYKAFQQTIGGNVIMDIDWDTLLLGESPDSQDHSSPVSGR